MPDAMTAPTHQRIPDPVFSWPPSGWWFTAIGALIGSALFVVPSLAEWPLLRRLLIFGLLILFAAALPVLVHLGRRNRAVARRARGYNAVVTSLDETKSELDRAKDEAKSELDRAKDEANSELDRANSVIDALVLERQERNSFRIAYCYVYDDKPMIALERKRGVRLKVGDSLTVIAPDLGALGTFEVIDDAGKQCRARSSGPINALWHGSMKQVGAARSEPPIRALAMRLSVEEDADDRENTESTT